MKKIIAVALALVMVLGLVACGNAAPAEKKIKVGIAAPSSECGKRIVPFGFPHPG